jgi:hypothetical protein
MTRGREKGGNVTRKMEEGERKRKKGEKEKMGSKR